MTEQNAEPRSQAQAALAGHAQLFDDFGLAPLGSRLAATFPTSLAHTPLIIDTDVGGDPDDAIALAIAARTVEPIGLVVTTDELAGRRAAYARALLDALGRTDVPVVAGADLGNDRDFCLDETATAAATGSPREPLEAIGDVLDAATGPVRWLGLGPCTNLARLLDQRPKDAPRLAVTQMGGALAYRDPQRAEHNVRLDTEAARHVLSRAGDFERFRLVTSDVTFSRSNELTAESPVVRELLRTGASRWAQLLAANLRCWFEHRYPATMQHDALALSVALELPFVTFELAPVEMAADGRMRRTIAGPQRFLSLAADYASFHRWLRSVLDGDHSSDTVWRAEISGSARQLLWQEDRPQA